MTGDALWIKERADSERAIERAERALERIRWSAERIRYMTSLYKERLEGRRVRQP